MQWNKEWTTPSVVGVISFGLGIGVGYAVRTYQSRAAKKLEGWMEEVESELVEMQYKLDDRSEKLNTMLQQASYVIGRFKTDGQEFLDQHAKDVKERLDDPSGLEFHEETATVFSGNDEDWNYEEEMKTRTKEIPYIIHRDEFFDNEKDYRQSTLTYYRGDNILCDELDTPVYNIDKIVGRLEFGKGSADPNVVYIRNEHLEAEYEILLDHGFFQVEVLGTAIEDNLTSDDVKHSLRKFRSD